MFRIFLSLSFLLACNCACVTIRDRGTSLILIDERFFVPSTYTASIHFSMRGALAKHQMKCEYMTGCNGLIPLLTIGESYSKNTDFFLGPFICPCNSCDYSHYGATWRCMLYAISDIGTLCYNYTVNTVGRSTWQKY